MLRIFNDLFQRYFSEEEALIYTLLLITGTIVMMTLGVDYFYLIAIHLEQVVFVYG